jgi:hypothetical protein
MIHHQGSSNTFGYRLLLYKWVATIYTNHACFVGHLGQVDYPSAFVD